jgi:hypothetical protein
LSFDLTFTKLDGSWYVQIVPSWFYSYNGYVQSHWHEDLLSTQKRLEHNSSVRNMVRFVAHFLSKLGDTENEDDRLRFISLVEFDVGEAKDEDEGGDDDVDDVADGAAA